MNSETTATTEKSIYLRMLSSPKSTFAQLLSLRSTKEIYVLMFLGSAAKAIDRAATQNMGDTGNLLYVLLMAIIAGGLMGIITYYIFGGMLSWTGKWLKGSADMDKMITVLAWSSLPIILSFGTLFIEVLFTGDAIFKSMPDLSSGGQLIVLIISLINFGLFLWSLSLTVIGISVAQNFSIGKSILNLFLPILVIVVPILLIIIIRGN